MGIFNFLKYGNNYVTDKNEVIEDNIYNINEINYICKKLSTGGYVFIEYIAKTKLPSLTKNQTAMNSSIQSYVYIKKGEDWYLGNITQNYWYKTGDNKYIEVYYTNINGDKDEKEGFGVIKIDDLKNIYEPKTLVGEIDKEIKKKEIFITYINNEYNIKKGGKSRKSRKVRKSRKGRKSRKTK
jgi:hypothetical protein